MISRWAAAALVFLSLQISLEALAAPPFAASPAKLPTPAGPGSGEPCLAVGEDGTVYMSWFEKLPKGHALKVARLDGSRWSKPMTVAAGDSFFVNWADFPQLAVLGPKHLALAWPWKSGADTYAYDVRIAQSKDGGRSWGRGTIPHRDNTPNEHGFVSLIPARGGVRAVWLDGRKFPPKKPGAGDHDEPGGEMTLRSAWIGPDGRLEEEAELDGRVCDCCQTGAASTGEGMVVVYRDRSDKEVRDISVVRHRDGAWTEGVPVAVDNWTITGCPVNGPVVRAREERVVVAWFTMVGDEARVRAAFSDHGGNGFIAPVDLPTTEALGRVDAVLLADGSALVCWMEAVGKEADIRIARVSTTAVIGEPVTVARTSAARASGFPRIVQSGRRVIVAWTETGARNQVRVAAATLASGLESRR